MIYDFLQLIPGLKIYGIDVSSYAIENSKNEVSQLLKIASTQIICHLKITHLIM